LTILREGSPGGDVLRYFGQRVASLVVVVFAISVFCYFLLHLLPGNPAEAILGFSYTPHAAAVLDRQLGLDKGIFAQYWTWLDNVLHGNLGISQVSGQPINRIISQQFPIDLELVALSQFIALIVAVPLSVYAARRPNGKLDQGATSSTFLLFSLPSFILVVWFINVLTIRNHVFPGPGTSPFPPGLPRWDEVAQNLYVMLLPSLILAAGSIAVYFRLLRSELVSTLQEEFIVVARSKGLVDRRILWHHALRPSLSTLLAATGNNVALLLTGLFIVEDKFAIHGVGYDLVAAIQGHDYLLVQGIALVAGVAVVAVNFLIDMLLPLLDPRIIRA
jgi:peptide/nickel transport system permease protein